MADPRLSVINERLENIGNIIAVSSGKGGVGKSIIACTLALALARRRYRVGLFDLDFTSPTTHLILGIEGVKPKEEKGIIPPRVHGLEYMSIVYYSGELATPLRGADVTNALIELLSVTKWGKLDFLVLDMPPGIGDATLDLVRLIKNIKFLIVTTPSQLAFETVRKLTSLLKDLRVPVIGIVENMKMRPSDTIRGQTEKLGLKPLAEIPYDEKLEAAIGNVNKLCGTAMAKEAERMASNIVYDSSRQVQKGQGRRS